MTNNLVKKRDLLLLDVWADNMKGLGNIEAHIRDVVLSQAEHSRQ